MINLLPSEQKEELLEEKKLKLILILGIVILAFLISLALILFTIKILFSVDLDQQKIQFEQKQKKMESPMIQELEEKIKKYNLIFSELETFYQNQPDLTAMLEKIFRALPQEIYLTSFNFDWQASQISLSGFSPTREILIQFKENLVKTDGLKEVSLSPDSWLEAVNIEFTVNFEINRKE